MIRKVNKKLVKVTSTILISAMFLTGCGADANAVAKVNGETISVEEYTKDFNIIKKRYETQYGPEFFAEVGPDGKTMGDVLKDNVLEKLVVEEIIMQKAEKEKFLATDEEVEEEIKNFKEMVGGQEGFDKFLETNGMNEEYFKSGIKKELTVEKYREKFLKELKMEDKEIEEYYKANKEKYDTIKASHILVNTEEEAKAILKELKDGGDFGALSAKSIEPGAAERQGDLGYFGKGQMVAEFEEAAFKLKVDELSEPVKTEHGFHIIKVTDKSDTFDKVKEDVKADLEDEKFGDHLEKIKEDAKVKTYDENVAKIGKNENAEVKDDEKKPATEKQPEVKTEDKKDEKVKEDKKDAKEEVKTIDEDKQNEAENKDKK